MAKRRSTWKTAHKASGATVIERSSKGCKLTVIPSDWTRPKGAAVWSVSCGSPRAANFDHKRGNSATVKSAKSAATRAARKLKRR
jgi:hypothetical protein